MEEIYNKWQLEDKDLGNTELYQFTKSELLDFAKYYHKQQLILHDVVFSKAELCNICQEPKEIQDDDLCIDCWQKYINF